MNEEAMRKMADLCVRAENNKGKFAKSRKARRPGLLAVIAIATAIFVTACDVGPKYHKPTAAVAPAYKELTPDQFKEVEGWKTATPADDVIRGKWWEMFNDPQLNSLEEQVNISNQNIALADAQFRAARALVKQARSQLFPTIGVSPSVTTSRFPTSGGTAVAPNTGSGSGATGATGTTPTTGTTGTSSTSTTSSGSGRTTDFSLPFDASWEPDLWGRVRNNIKSNVYLAQASAADLENVRLTLQAELAVDYYQLRGLDAQKKLLDDTVEAFQKALDLTKALYETGIDSAESVSQAETQLESTQAQDTNTGIQRAQFEHAIAVLIGKPASVFSLPFAPIQVNPPAVPFGVPSQLLERRPDIAAAERSVASANAQIGVAIAAYYPNLTLTASGGFESSTIGSLLTWPSRFWSVGAQLAETLFDGGLRKGVTEQARAVYDETVATYRQDVLAAIQAVEDNLAELRILSQEKQQQTAAVNSAQKTLDIAIVRYRTGIDPYLNVISAQTALLSNQQTELTLEIEQMTSSVQLIMAVGGGWDSSKMPTPAQLVSSKPINP
jgi:NodT family efflux transporter outer membrane factor (OMF) lipoprotein